MSAMPSMPEATHVGSPVHSVIVDTGTHPPPPPPAPSPGLNRAQYCVNHAPLGPTATIEQVLFVQDKHMGLTRMATVPRHQLSKFHPQELPKQGCISSAAACPHAPMRS